VVDQSSPVTISEQQAVPVAQVDWRLIAKAAGEHGVRYRTNTALLAFLDEIEPARKADRFDPALPCKSGEGAGEIERLKDRIAVLERENSNYAKTMDIIGQLPADLRTDATQTREAELVAAVERLIQAADDADHIGTMDEPIADVRAALNARGGA